MVPGSLARGNWAESGRCASLSSGATSRDVDLQKIMVLHGLGLARFPKLPPVDRDPTQSLWGNRRAVRHGILVSPWTSLVVYLSMS